MSKHLAILLIAFLTTIAITFVLYYFYPNVLGKTSSDFEFKEIKNVLGFGFLENTREPAFIDSNGRIIGMCSKKTAYFTYSKTLLKNYANCFSHFYINKDNILYIFCIKNKKINQKIKTVQIILFILNKNRLKSYEINLFNNNSSYIIHLLPCIHDSCFAMLFANYSGIFTKIVTNNSYKIFRSNSLLLEYLNESIIVSVLNEKYNESKVVDLLTGETLFYIPSIKPLFLLGKPFVQVARINNSIKIVILTVMRNGRVGYFVSKPNDYRFSFYPAILAVTPDANTIIERHENYSIIWFSDGKKIRIDYPVSIEDYRGFWGLPKPKEAIVYINNSNHTVLVRVFEKGKALIKYIGSNFEKKIFSTKPNKIGSLFAWLCPKTKKIIVLDREATKIYVFPLENNYTGSPYFISPIMLSITLVLLILFLFVKRMSKKLKLMD